MSGHVEVGGSILRNWTGGRQLRDKVCPQQELGGLQGRAESPSEEGLRRRRLLLSLRQMVRALSWPRSASPNRRIISLTTNTWERKNNCSTYKDFYWQRDERGLRRVRNCQLAQSCEQLGMRFHVLVVLPPFIIFTLTLKPLYFPHPPPPKRSSSVGLFSKGSPVIYSTPHVNMNT